jgi:hypothetical protein
MHIKLITGPPFSTVTMEQAAAAIASVTSLTRLALMLDNVDGVDMLPVDWCAPMSRLPQLRCLSMHEVLVCQQGILQLSGLTSLTDLHLFDIGLGNVSAVAVAIRMTNLQHLRITDNLCSAILLPVLASLTTLRRLYLCGSNDYEDDVTDRELLMLTSLSRLSYLNIPGHICSDMAKQRLVEQLPELSEVLDS